MRQLFKKTVAALGTQFSIQRHHVAKWIISAMVHGVEKRQYGSRSGSCDSYVTFCDNAVGVLKTLKIAALKLAELADKGKVLQLALIAATVSRPVWYSCLMFHAEAAQERPFQWTPAQEQSPLYPILHEICSLDMTPGKVWATLALAWALTNHPQTLCLQIIDTFVVAWRCCSAQRCCCHIAGSPVQRQEEAPALEDARSPSPAGGLVQRHEEILASEDVRSPPFAGLD